ncbi:PAP2-domain-containing protein [Aulographum hederae CBS 113979]|uniref:PAP2-domain-containing protein n=1 Tax=Aulographum hederae CBS 113979 TaxID=1176131 RepID=A0A6G1GMT6_9PEZI|nr:PAP2-domain-containing protein [Aulographum hederae CBS 113979]
MSEYGAIGVQMPSSNSPKTSWRTAGLSQRQSMTASFTRFWRKTYASDYAGLAALITAYILIIIFVEPFHRMFTLDNVSIQYPHALHERVPVPWLFILAAGVPLVVIILWAAILRHSAHRAHVTILALLTSLILTSFLTDVIKNAVGRPRPDLLSRCKPAPGTPGSTLVDFTVCTEKDHHTLHDGFRSFPSGHSSFSFAGLGFLALFLSSQLRVFRPRVDLARVLVALAPLLGAALIAFSRLQDYRHDVWDVTSGSVLGMLVAYTTWRRYYPGLRSRKCAEPWPNPVDVLVGSSKGKRRDEEDLVGVRASDAEEFELADESGDEMLGEGRR